MPIYEYECADCGNRFEKLLRIGDQPEMVCDQCRGAHVKRILSPGAFLFKGSGFYATDYKNKTNGKSGTAGKDSNAACSTCPAPKEGGCSATGGD
ncbi:MAG: zinc ribbon domain-containing protein [Gemmatimonadota bacterium]|nr:zinc ribbon domain-containing protein [Gemmatimonadota bacterium]